VLTLERPADMPFDPPTVELCESVAALAGPILDTHRREDRWLITKILDSARTHLAHLFGPGHLALKLGTLATAGLLAFCVFAKGDYRVSAKTVLEPVLQRAAVAPFNSYIREAPVRAGDVVAKGHLLAWLDDRELRLERLKALSESQEYQKQLHKAMAERKASDVEIVTAQIAQAKAKVDLLDDQLSRTRIVAPFDALVVTGDLSQMLGSPVEKGKVLFELAPADQYRLVVQVDERDVADVKVGQRGTLLLSAFPHDPLAFTVQKVTPVSEAKEGRNFFRVEAQFDQPPPRLRPGMEGVGKVEIDERSLIWIWTHQVVDWVRLALWTWLP
jgi:multidrug efflux pump subunit AcrA (membrane-fusion protein)